MKPKKSIKPKVHAGIIRRKKPRLGLMFAKGLQQLRELPEGALSDSEQTILKRMQDIHTGATAGRLTWADYVNLKRIAEKHGIKL